MSLAVVTIFEPITKELSFCATLSWPPKIPEWLPNDLLLYPPDTVEQLPEDVLLPPPLTVEQLPNAVLR